MSEQTKKASYIGAPAIFALELACQHIRSAFGNYGCYLVGSSMEKPDWRDVDVRFIMPDDAFANLFPCVDLSIDSAIWEFDPRWLLLTVSITSWLREQTGLPIDFQIQPQTFANKHHDKQRSAIGLRIAKREDVEAMKEFEREMEDKVIPEIVETIAERQKLAEEDRGILR